MIKYLLNKNNTNSIIKCICEKKTSCIFLSSHRLVSDRVTEFSVLSNIEIKYKNRLSPSRALKTTKNNIL